MVESLKSFVLPGKANIILGGQFGSEAKGLIAGAIGLSSPIDIVTTNNAVQSGHTFVREDGTSFVGFHIPTSGIVSEAQIHLNAGAIIDLEKLAEELEEFKCADRTIIHPRATIITKEDKEYEGNVSSGAAGLASTQKGVGRAFARKIMRETNLAESYRAEIEAMGAQVGVVDVMGAMEMGARVVVEVPQGYSLSINAGLGYPTCTSRDCTVAQALSDANIHPSFLGNVMVALRAFPIRVGNLVVDGKEVGNSGGGYPDQVELNWDHFSDLGVKPELTTVTKRVRKIFTFSPMQYAQMVKSNRPTHVFLNFVNYMHDQVEFQELVRKMSEVYPILSHYGVGPKVSDIYSQGEEAALYQRLGWQDAAN